MVELKEIILDIYSRSKFFQRKYKNIDLSEFYNIPFISKKDLLQDQLDNPPFGSNVCVPFEKIKRIHRTSGTTSRPLLLTLTDNDIKNVNNIGAKAFILAGVEKDDIIVNCMNYCMWMGGLMDHMSLEQAGACVIPYGVGNTENLINLLLDIPNASLHCTPSYLSIIKRVLQEKFNKNPNELKLKKGFFGGESGIQNPIFRKSIEEEWGIIAINANYGISEVISIMGAECKYRNGLHFMANDLLFVELVDNQNNIVPIEEGSMGELVITTLQKESQPLIRYRTGDVVEIISIEKCNCGNDSFRFNIIGRADNMLVIKGINFFPESIKPLLSKYSGLSSNYYIEIIDKQPIENVTLVLEIDENYSKIRPDISSLLKEIKEKFFITPEIRLEKKIITDNSNKLSIIKRIK